MDELGSLSIRASASPRLPIEGVEMSVLLIPHPSVNHATYIFLSVRTPTLQTGHRLVDTGHDRRPTHSKYYYYDDDDEEVRRSGAV
jgi:hypothetical protein